MPNAAWSGVASTAAASGVSANRTSSPSIVDADRISFAAAWLYAHSRTHRSSRPAAAASSADVSGTLGVGERPVQPESVAEVDHPGGDRAFELREDLELRRA